jgi:hypothetical protein
MSVKAELRISALEKPKIDSRSANAIRSAGPKSDYASVPLAFLSSSASSPAADLPSPASLQSFAREKELRALNTADLSSQFDLLIGKSLLPILATLVGYMLGRKK